MSADVTFPSLHLMNIYRDSASTERMPRADDPLRSIDGVAWEATASTMQATTYSSREAANQPTTDSHRGKALRYHNHNHINSKALQSATQLK
jgi:hypothetical protein